MKERPILFSGEMVRALLEGNKTQTRRAINPQPEQCRIGKCAQAGSHWIWKGHHTEWDAYVKHRGLFYWENPYGQPGDRLWVRENLVRSDYALWGMYAADRKWVTSAPPAMPLRICWHSKRDRSLCRSEERKYVPSIHMPRIASRITLEVVKVRAERVMEITAADAIAEGIEFCRPSDGCEIVYKDYVHNPDDEFEWYSDPVDSYRSLWEKINGKGSWTLNPWVWVVEFRRVDGGVLMVDGKGRK